MTLQRLVLTFKPEEVVMHALYRRRGDGPNPSTKARTREVTELTRQGPRKALVALEGDAECVGTSGFTTKEDVILATDSPAALGTKRQAKTKPKGA